MAIKIVDVTAPDSNTGRRQKQFLLEIDEMIIPTSSGYNIMDDFPHATDGRVEIRILNYELYQTISQHPMEQVAAVLSAIRLSWGALDVVIPSTLDTEISHLDFQIYVRLHGANLFDQATAEGWLIISCDAYNWKQLWSPTEFLEECVKIANQDNLWLEQEIQGVAQSLDITFDDEDSEPSISIGLSSQDEKETPVVKIVPALLPSVAKLYLATNQSLASKLQAGTVVAQFHFPPEVAVPCEQYLMYFVQFLRDLGVEAKANLQHDAGNVLFSIAPDNKEIALDKIHEALAVYLQLPTNPGVGGGMIGIGDVQGQQLMANVNHLQGQLMLANAVLQTKDATIQMQQMTIVHQQNALDGTVLLNSLQRVEDGQEKTKDKEELLGGAMALTKYEGKGYEINIPHIYRHLRELFSQK